MNVVNVSTRLPSIPGSYPVIVKPTNGLHKAVAVGISFQDGHWHGTDDTVVAWVDPQEEAVTVPALSVVPDVEHTYTLVLAGGGPNKIGVIKLIRELLGLGLGESKAFVEASPTERKVVKTGLGKIAAEELKGKLVAAGAIVNVETEE